MRISLSMMIAAAVSLNAVLFAQSNETAKVEKANEVIEDIMDIPEKSIPPQFMQEAYGIAIIPDVLKVGLTIGGRYGKGILVVKNQAGMWSNPAFITLTGGSIGWQIGIQSTDIILVFRNKKSVDAILDGKFTLGADASIAAGPVGRHVGAKTDIEFRAEIYSYSQSRGLFAGIALEGAAIQTDHDANENFYHDRKITPREILWGQVPNAPDCAQELRRTLSKYSKRPE
jgi:lipid-binding SYLF domain-containing protein